MTDRGLHGLWRLPRRWAYGHSPAVACFKIMFVLSLRDFSGALIFLQSEHFTIASFGITLSALFFPCKFNFWSWKVFLRHV